MHPRDSQLLMEKAQLCCSWPASECLHTRLQWVPAHSYSLGMGDFSLGLLLKHHRHSLHSSLPSGESQSTELFLRCLFGTRTISKFCIFTYSVALSHSAAHHLPSASLSCFFFCLHPSLACVFQGEIPGLQTAEPAVQCHVKGKQTPAIQELKWLGRSVVRVKMESTKQSILEITGADFAVPGEVMRPPLVCCVGIDGITNRDVLLKIPPSMLLFSCSWCRRNQQWDPLEEKGQSHAPRSALTSCCQPLAFHGEYNN